MNPGYENPAASSSSSSCDDCGFIYRVRQDVAAPPLHLDETVYAPAQRLPKHFHPRPMLFSLLEGSAVHTVDGESRSITPGEVAFIPPRTFHSVVFGHGIGRVFSVEFDEGRCMADRVVLPSRSIHSADVRLVSTVLGTYRIFARREALYGGMLANQLASALAPIDTRPCDMPAPEVCAWLREAVERVRQSASGPVRMNAIARQLGVHPVHLSRHFHQVFGESMSAFRERTRLERVTRALLTQSRTISAIAAELGFADHAHLTRSFRRAAQMTPSEFRDVIDKTGLPHEVMSNLRASRTLILRGSMVSGIRVA
jgi:AraC family transcriptional regulator